MQRLQLYIEDNEGNYPLVDLFDDEMVELTSTIQDVKDIGKVFTDYSQTFTVPASDTNNKIFRHYYNYHITGNAFDSRKKKQALLHINYAPFRRGKIYLNSVKMKDNKAYAYELTFYGNTVSLKDLLGDDELTDLPYLNNFNHKYTDTIVKEGFEDGLDFVVGTETKSDAIIYPLITSKKRLFFNSDDPDDIEFNSTGNIYYNDNPQDNSRGLEFTDLKPAIRAYNIIEAIEDKYNLSFTKDFFTSPAFENLYLWLSNIKGEFNQQDDFKLFEHYAKTAEYQDNTTYRGPASSWTNQDIPEVTFENDIVTITKSTGADEYKIALRSLYSPKTAFDIVFTEVDELGNEIGEYVTKIGELLSAPDYGTFVGYYTAFPSSSSAGTRRFKTKVRADNWSSISPILHVIKDSGGTPVLEAWSSISSDVRLEIDISITDDYVMPKMKVIDFLTGLFKMFNLTAYYIDDLDDSDYNLNNKPTIYVDTLDNYYADAVNNKLGATIDITKYIDSTEHMVSSVMPFSDIEFKYNSNDSLLMRNHEEQFNEIFGDAEFDVRNDFTDPVTGEYLIDRGTKYQIDVPFTHMKFERLINLARLDDAYEQTDNTGIQWGYSAGGEFSADTNVSPPTGDYDSLDVKPLLFYAIRETNLPVASVANDYVDGRINWIFGGNSNAISNYWRPSNSNESGNSTTPPAYTLNFDQEVDEWQKINYSTDVAGAETNSLYYVFYRSYVRSVFNPAKRMFKLTAYLPTSIIINYRLNDQIKIHDKMFRINSITTNLNTGKSELELLNIFTDEIVE